MKNNQKKFVFRMRNEHRMTKEEFEAFEALTKVANLMLHLPLLHPMEKEETCHDIHKLQLRLLARPGLRAIGWKEKKSKKIAERLK